MHHQPFGPTLGLFVYQGSGCSTDSCQEILGLSQSQAFREKVMEPRVETVLPEHSEEYLWF